VDAGSRDAKRDTKDREELTAARRGRCQDDPGCASDRIGLCHVDSGYTIGCCRDKNEAENALTWSPTWSIMPAARVPAAEVPAVRRIGAPRGCRPPTADCGSRAFYGARFRTPSTPSDDPVVAVTL